MAVGLVDFKIDLSARVSLLGMSEPLGKKFTRSQQAEPFTPKYATCCCLLRRLKYNFWVATLSCEIFTVMVKENISYFLGPSAHSPSSFSDFQPFEEVHLNAK